METVVSKTRTQKTKSRQKQAVRTAGVRKPWRNHAGVGVGIALLLWLATLLLMESESLVRGRFDSVLKLQFVGDAALLLIGLFATGLFLKLTRPDIVLQNSKLLLLATAMLVSLVPAKLLVYVLSVTQLVHPGAVGFLLPFAMAPLLVTILVGPVCAVTVGVWSSLAMTMFLGDSLSLFLAGLVVTVVAAETARRVRTRSKVIRAGVIAGVAEIACIFGHAALHWGATDVVEVLNQAGACVVAQFLAALLALLVLPAFESAFRITTDITLLELADLSHPLLQRLALEAPGTYHHSLVVASLAQAAAEEIGANPLLARVCAYFHDIGKLVKPEFFSENMRMNRNPHDDLPPSMSHLVITSHVKEGISLALLHKLPDPVMDVIREHHGTSLLSFFHHKAKTQLENDGEIGNGSANGKEDVAEWNYRYGGPKPGSRESAIIGLADSIEAASRSIEKVTPGHIEGLVSELVNTRMQDGQLDDCGLTLAQLSRVKSSFVFTLTSMMHGRPAYPKDEDRNQQPSKTPPAKPPAVSVPDTTLHG